MVQGIEAAIVRAYRAAKERAAETGDTRTLQAVANLTAETGRHDFLSTGADKFSPSPLRAVVSGDIKSPWDTISTD